MAKQQQGQFKFIDGRRFPIAWPDWMCQLTLFRYAPKLQEDPHYNPADPSKPSEFAYCGLGRHSHSRIITEMLRPNFQWHDWSIKADQTFCENQATAICGGGGSSKSYTAGDYGFKFWLCAPADTAVLIASTSIDAARKRIWKSISTAFSEVSRRLHGLRDGSLVNNPKPGIRTRKDGKDDFVHGIYVIPVEQGDINQAVDAIKGYHTKRMLLIGDETDAISQAIVDVQANLRIGTEEFQAIWLGNLPSGLNPLGKLMEPAPGKPVSEMLGTEWISAKGLQCLRFDGEQSPNIRDNGKWTGLMTEEDRAAIERQAGGKNTRTYYVMVKGLVPPEGVDDTVVSEPLLHAHGAFDKVVWKSGFIVSASLDFSKGGDMCCYRTFKRGDDADGVFRCAIDEIIPIPVTTGDPKNPAEYIVAKKVIELSKARGITPDEFMVAVTGIGSGIGAVLQREWSPSIHTCEEGGSPSDLIVSEEDPRPAKDIYDRRVTELWFSIREFIQANLIRQLDDATATQLGSRKWDYKNKKKSVQKKEEMPSSPDEADGLAFYVELLRRKGINASVQTAAKSAAGSSLEKEAREQDFEETYAEEWDAA